MIRMMTADLPFPFSGRPRCAKRPELECTAECEYGIAGPCGHEKPCAMTGSTRLRNTAISKDRALQGAVCNLNRPAVEQPAT